MSLTLQELVAGKSAEWCEGFFAAVNLNSATKSLFLKDIIGQQVVVREITDADSANLARGLALEQAAQVVADWYGHSEADELGAGVENEIRSLDPDAAQALAHYNATVFHDTLDDLAHDGSELVVGGKEPVRIFSEEALAAHEAKVISKYCDEDLEAHFKEIERRAWLDEAKWWYQHAGLGMCYRPCTGKELAGFPYCQRIAALAESQPAPAKQPLSYEDHCV